MLKILRTGLKPAQIKRLIYHHYDPDLCGSLRSWRRSSTPKSCASSRRWKTMSLSTIIPRRHQSWTIA
jgi:flavorubredoxin